MTVPARSLEPAVHEAPTRDASGYPRFRRHLPSTEIAAGRYVVRFAQSVDDLRAVQRLRFKVFNLELGEGLDASYRTGLDEDELDGRFHHLMIVAAASGDVVGTYRMQTADMAGGVASFYSAGEFDLSRLPVDVVANAVEIGRACVAADHRNGRVLHLLWRGLASYLSWNAKRYLFGCCSLPTLDPSDARRALDLLVRGNHLHPQLQVAPLPAARCADVPSDPAAVDAELPPLFQSYLELGAKVCGPPALDRLFKTIDFLVLLDVQGLDDRTYRTFFRDHPRRAVADGRCVANPSEVRG